MFHHAFFNSITDKHQHMHTCVGVYQLLNVKDCSTSFQAVKPFILILQVLSSIHMQSKKSFLL